jgi:type III pantothenate kinase
LEAHKNIILYDGGNTNTKIYYNGVVKSVPSDSNFLLPSEKFYYINVNNRLNRYFASSSYGINLENYINLKTSYHGLGIDRKIVCKAISDGVIVDAGSAITVDIMHNGTHLGGFITLGLHSFEQSFANISDSLIFDLDNNIDLSMLPQNTHEALNYAVFQAVISSIKAVLKKEQKIYFCGGDGKILMSFFKNSEYRKNLVFDGMKQVIKESGC